MKSETFMAIRTEHLRSALMTLMEREGTPLARVSGRHGLAKVYRIPNGKTVLVRTNHKPAIMTVAASGVADAHIAFEDVDHVAIAFPGERRNSVVAYLIPAHEAVRHVREKHAKWLERQPGGVSTSRVRV